MRGARRDKATLYGRRMFLSKRVKDFRPVPSGLQHYAPVWLEG